VAILSGPVGDDQMAGSPSKMFRLPAPGAAPRERSAWTASYLPHATSGKDHDPKESDTDTLEVVRHRFARGGIIVSPGCPFSADRKNRSVCAGIGGQFAQEYARTARMLSNTLIPSTIRPRRS